MSSPVTGTRFPAADAYTRATSVLPHHSAEYLSCDDAAPVRQAADNTGPASIFGRFETAARLACTPQTAFAFARALPTPPAHRPALDAATFTIIAEQASSGCFSGLCDWFRELAAKIVSWWRDSDANREIRGIFRRVTDDQLARISVPERRTEVRALLDALVDPASGWPLDMRDVATVVRKVRSEKIRTRLEAVMDGLDARLANARHDAADVEADIGAAANALLPQETAGVRDAWPAGKRRLVANLNTAASIVRTDRLLVRKLPQSMHSERMARDQLARAATAIDRAEAITATFRARLAVARLLSTPATAIVANAAGLNCAATLQESE